MEDHSSLELDFEGLHNLDQDWIAVGISCLPCLVFLIPQRQQCEADITYLEDLLMSSIPTYLEETSIENFK